MKLVIDDVCKIHWPSALLITAEYKTPHPGATGSLINNGYREVGLSLLMGHFSRNMDRFRMIRIEIEDSQFYAAD